MEACGDQAATASHQFCSYFSEEPSKNTCNPLTQSGGQLASSDKGCLIFRSYPFSGLLANFPPLYFHFPPLPPPKNRRKEIFSLKKQRQENLLTLMFSPWVIIIKKFTLFCPFVVNSCSVHHILPLVCVCSCLQSWWCQPRDMLRSREWNL